MSETKTWLDDQAGREVFRPAVQPVLADWGLEDQVEALVNVLFAVTRKGYCVGAAREMLIEIEITPEDNEIGQLVGPVRRKFWRRSYSLRMKPDS
jgi:hypothetical protein